MISKARNLQAHFFRFRQLFMHLCPSIADAGIQIPKRRPNAYAMP
jgi:hypothetical protein